MLQSQAIGYPNNNLTKLTFTKYYYFHLFTCKTPKMAFFYF
ncbi:MAG: Unknown protein [uncultured Aureispira sp.]|uniref:Uncharacterized protein n=1 Tax=uncultured Aureispira sp. TaxID=1331704 RepID=A0A6S6S4V0_9BACT|nr:MAG: Unknown protein [uncultured Aureispira sp.]